MKYSFLFFFSFMCFISCNSSKARRPLNKKTATPQNKSVAFNKALASFEQKQIKAYIARDTTLNYTYSPYGFAYAKIKSPKKHKKNIYEGSELLYAKTVYALNNKLIYETYIETCKIGKSNLPKGIQEGLKLMQEDAEFKFIFSSFVAYGFHGDRYKIGANTPLIINIKLLKINN